MSIFQYYCDNCGEFNVNRRISDDLSKVRCVCGRSAKRVWYAPNHIWVGMQSPTYEHDVSAIRFRNNKKIYGESEAMNIEAGAKKRR
jgi:putative FmdB family regulatory protein